MFFCVFYTCNGLICSSQSRLCMVFPFCRIQHPKKNKKQTNKKPRNSTKKREHNPKKPKNKETKQIAHPKRGKMQRIGSRHVFCFVCFFGLLSFWFLVSFEGLAEQKKWQDLTFCYFSQLRVCKFGFCYCLLWVCGFMTKLRQNHRKM